MKEIAIAIIGSGALSALVSALVQLACDKKRNLSKFEKGMRLLLLSTIKRDGKDLVAGGKITKKDYDAFTATYDAYKSLGGDGWADKMKSEIDALPIDYTD